LARLSGRATGNAGTNRSRAFGSPEVLKLSDDDLIGITTNGHNKMPAYKGKLTDAQIKNLTAYIHTVQKK
jgi:mono/diheme cytochrome c family protein